MHTLLQPYAELDCISNFTFLTGASHPEDLVSRASQLGYKALALSDDCSLAGMVRAHLAAREHGLKLIVGSRFKIDSDQGSIELIVLATNLEGYGNLSELITLARTRESKKGQYLLTLDDLLQPPPTHVHLQGLPHCLVILKPPYGTSATALEHHLHTLTPLFKGRLWLGLALHHHQDDVQHIALLNQAAQVHDVNVVALGGVQMHTRSKQPLHDALTAIRLGRPIAECGYALACNAEHYLRRRSRLAQLYPPESLRETLVLSDLCSFDLEEIKYQYPGDIVPAGLTPSQYLRQETYAGAQRRYPRGISPKVQAQLESELEIIASLQYEPYFLTVYDIVLFARRQGILCQGRGSAANSAGCYCLGITEVDPENGNSLFARFISTARNEPPDIDVDFEHQRREEVIQYIYQKYGREKAALTAVVTTYRTRSVLRDTGKALGLDLDLIDRVAKSCQYWDDKNDLLDKIAQQGLDRNARIVRLWAGLAQGLRGFPRHLSQHPGGFVMCHGKLSRLVPIENAAMAQRSVVQWDKDDLDAMRLLKVDILGLGMLSVIRRALEGVALRRGVPFSMQDVPHHDAATFEMISRADTVGVFQIESRAQMSMLPRMQPRQFYDLVIQVAIVRPGPIQGGMVHPYLRRRQGDEKTTYPSPEIKAVLKRTLGVPIFQEQAMQIAVKAGGFTPDEADQLRRSMAAWRRKGGINHFHAKLVDGMMARGYSKDYAESIFKQLEGFGEYGFPESHAASFAKLAYISAWIKCHEPEAFLVALLNSQPMGFYSPSQLVQDARRHDVQVLPVDVTASHWEATLVSSSDSFGTRPAVRMGLNQVSGLSEQAGLRIETARAEAPFKSIHDLALRASLDRRDMDALAGANALAALSGHRRQAHWQAANLPFKGLLREAPVMESEAPQLTAPTEGQEIIADYRSLGLTLGRHPLTLLRKLPDLHSYASARQLASYPDRRLARACGLVTMRQRPSTAKGIVFVSLEDETGIINVIVRPELVERQRNELIQSRLLGVYGVWQHQKGVCHLLASRLVNLNDLLGQLPIQSRNFH